MSNYAVVPASTQTKEELQGTTLMQIRPQQNNGQQAET